MSVSFAHLSADGPEVENLIFVSLARAAGEPLGLMARPIAVIALTDFLVDMLLGVGWVLSVTLSPSPRSNLSCSVYVQILLI